LSGGAKVNQSKAFFTLFLREADASFMSTLDAGLTYACLPCFPTDLQQLKQQSLVILQVLWAILFD